MSARTERVVPRHIVRPQGGGAQPCLTVEQAVELAQLHERGVSVGELAQRYGVHPSTVTRYVRGQGGTVKRRVGVGGRPLSTDDLLQLGELVAQGYSATDIAQLLNVSPSAVRWRLRKHGSRVEWRGRKSRLPARETT